MSSDPLSDFMLNLAAGLTQTLLEAGARRLSQAALGTDEERALRTALAQGFNALVTEADAQLPPGELRQETVRLVGDIFTEFLSAPAVADNLLALALAGAPPDMPRLAAAFAALDYDRATLPVDFERCLIAFHRGMTAVLVAAATHAGSPLFHQVSLGRTLAIQVLLEDQQRSLVAVADQVRRLEAQGGQVVYNIVIERAIGPVAIGEHAQAGAIPQDIREVLNQILSRIEELQRQGSITPDVWQLDLGYQRLCATVDRMFHQDKFSRAEHARLLALYTEVKREHDNDMASDKDLSNGEQTMSEHPSDPIQFAPRIFRRAAKKLASDLMVVEEYHGVWDQLLVDDEAAHRSIRSLQSVKTEVTHTSPVLDAYVPVISF